MPDPGSPPAARRTRRRRRTTVGGVLGELFMTLGVLVMGFVGWQQWLADDIMGGQQQAAAANVAMGYDQTGSVALPDEQLQTGEPPVDAAVADRESFAVVYIPRLDPMFARVVGEGTSRHVLDSLDLGLAHYASSAMPGEVGNFAIAGHRNGQGGPFTQLDEMQVGDRIYVQTASAWYVYEYRNSEYVPPTAVGVVGPVPQVEGAAPTDRLMTLTTCNPEWSPAGRLIAYASFVGWSASMPAELAAARGEG